MRKEFYFICFFVLFSTVSKGQPRKNPLRIGLTYHHGFLYNHSEERAKDRGISLSALNGAEVSFQWQTIGTKSWHKHWKYPFWGMSALIYSIPAPTYGGNCYAWLIYLGTHFIKTKHYELNMRLGTGVGAFESPYNKEYNPKNLWVSAPFNTSMNINIENKIRVNDSVFITFGGAFTHFSNGAVMMPNLGVNYPTLHVGLKIYPHYNAANFRRDTINEYLAKYYFHVSASFGSKVLPDFGTTYYPVYSMSLQAGRRLSKVYKMFVSIDGFRDESLLADSLVRLNNNDINRIGAFLGNEFLMGPLSMYFGFGRYLYKKTVRDADYYIKVGLRYHFYKNVFAGLALKTHWGQADSFEWTIGYSFRR
ncbi:MAG: acyloxyacyl hydrolase [Bacteroidota bacterium]|nr:acyloxyacyl hydrolase [Bacteroidota bacterium]